MSPVVTVRSVFAPKPWRHPLQAWRMRRIFRRLRAQQAAIESLITPEMVEQFARREEDLFIRGTEPDWRCECGDLNRGHEAFCYRCGAGQPEEEK